MRIPFASLFEVHEDGNIEPRVRIRIGGVTIGPGTVVSRGVNIGGIDLATYTGRDYEVDIENDVYVIKGIY